MAKVALLKLRHVGHVTHGSAGQYLYWLCLKGLCKANTRWKPTRHAYIYEFIMQYIV